jgi:hypothetical protein
MTDAEEVARLADELIAAHLPGRGWRFGLDNARRRAGACDYARRRITVSRHLVAGSPIDEVRQVLLHEIAHALAGSRAAHGPVWRRTARGIGYTGSRLHEKPIAEGLAPWVGRCPAGHEHHRFRRPSAPLSCGICARRFSSAALIVWERREVVGAPA